MIKGLDVGYSYTKDNEKRIFKSAMSQMDKAVSGAIKITIDGNTYFVGTGRGTVDIDKADSELTKVCLLANLALTPASDFYIVTGLPIAQYREQKDKLKHALLKYRRSTVIINGVQKDIVINDVTVFPQSAGALYSQDILDDALIVDIGGRTVDVALLEVENGKLSLQKCDTWYKGMLTLYGSVVDEVNRRYGLTLEPHRAEKILTKGLSVLGKPQDLDFLRPLISEHLDPMIDEISLNYPAFTTHMYLCGGGAALMSGIFKKHFPNLEVMADCQFANAIGFYKIGQQLYGKYEKERAMAWQRKD